MSYSKQALMEIAEAPRPKSGTPEYQRWRRARVICGLATKIDDKSEHGRKYNTEYQRRYRKLHRSCITCKLADEDMVCRSDSKMNGLWVGGTNDWHCSLWKKKRKIRVIL